MIDGDGDSGADAGSGWLIMLWCTLTNTSCFALVSMSCAFL